MNLVEIEQFDHFIVAIFKMCLQVIVFMKKKVRL